MKDIALPNKVFFAKDEGNKSVLTIEPLYPGYGVTLGNALRRVLLSSLPGGAVTAVKIKGADHEFSTIPGVREDVVDIILNLKQLRLKLHSDEPVKLELKARGPKEVRAGDITPSAQVEIVNKDLLLATLDSKSVELVMEITVEQGRGYVPVEMREGERAEIGAIAVDAIFSPVRNINFTVDNVRVGQITNYDKLIITMETDGTVTGAEAMDMAAKILVDHFSLLLTSEVSQPVEEMEPVPETLAAVDDLHKLDLSNRAINALRRNGISTVVQLQELKPDELEALEGLGAKSIEEIAAALVRHQT